jgi:hypothetical protein
MAVGAQKGFSGNTETLHVDLVGNSVAGRTVMNAESSGRALQVRVIVRILEIGLNDIVVYVLDGQLRSHAINPHGFELEHGHGSRGILQQCVIDSYGDFLSGDQLPFHEMIRQNFIRKTSAHYSLLSGIGSFLGTARMKILLPSLNSSLSKSLKRIKSALAAFIRISASVYRIRPHKSTAVARPPSLPDSTQSDPCPKIPALPPQHGITQRTLSGTKPHIPSSPVPVPDAVTLPFAIYNASLNATTNGVPTVFGEFIQNKSGNLAIYSKSKKLPVNPGEFPSTSRRPHAFSSDFLTQPGNNYIFKRVSN